PTWRNALRNLAYSARGETGSGCPLGMPMPGSEPAAPPKGPARNKRGNGVMKQLADVVAADTTSIYDSRAADLPPWGRGKYAGCQPFPTPEEPPQVAYSLYESRGRQDGHDVEDWLRAEQEPVRRYA